MSTLAARSEATDRPLARQAVDGLRQAARDTAYLLLGLPLGILGFTFVVTGAATSLGLAVTLIGLPLAAVVVLVSRGLARIERVRAALVLGAPIPVPYRSLPDASPLRRFLALFRDPATWKDLAWLLALLPLGIGGFVVATVAWSLPLALLSIPAWWWSIPQDEVQLDFGLFRVDTWPEALAPPLLGVILLPLAVALIRGAASATAALARVALGPGRGVLEARVEELRETRAGAVDAARAELERIERDLHDGAQARMVSVALDLGLAERKLDSEPEAARALVADAREGAKQALAELREIAQGLRPGLLAERGLGEALTSLAARGPVPTTVTVRLRERLPEPVEAAAYFVVAEALANIGKHSGAATASVRVGVGDEGRLEVEVGDDGRGGADPAGSGLVGLRQRVEALDGRLTVDSPPGGPTVLRAELPCAA